MSDPFQTPKQEVPPSSESPGGLDELRQSVGQGQLNSLLRNFADTDPEKRKETLKQVKTALIGAGVVAAAAYILSDEKEKKDAEKPAEESRTEEEPKSETQVAEEKPDQDVEKVQEPKAKEEPKPEPEAEVLPYRPGDKAPHVTDKSTFRADVERIYAQEKTLFTVNNLNEYFGRDYKKFLIYKDPVMEGNPPITFLGKPITGGINLMMLPFLRIAEKKIMDLGLNYVPKEAEVRGFQDRNMATGKDEHGNQIYDPNIPSFHKYGLAVDIDPDFNWPKDGRGTIPNEVILAMAEAGFACGSISDPSFHYLMNDTMHYQMRFPPDSAPGQRIIDASPIGTRYWKAISPMLEAIKGAA